MRRLFLALVILGLVAGLVAAYIHHARGAIQKDELTLWGNVDVRQVEMGFRVAGQVRELFFEEGDAVKTGALLATLVETPYDKQFVEAQASEEAIRVAFSNAETLLNRRKDLIQNGGVSQEDLDNAQTNYNQLKSTLAQYQSTTAVAHDNLVFTRLYAPTDGVILTRIREPGTVVNPSEPVYTLSVTSPVWIRAYVDEPQLGLIYYGMPAEITTDTPTGTSAGKMYTGKIGFISPVAEFTPKTVQTTTLRTDLVYRLRIYADNPDKGLLQGMPVTVKIKLSPPA